MQSTTQSWKEAHQRTMLREAYVEVSLGITDPDAVEDASSQDNGSAYLSKTSNVLSEVDKDVAPYSTLEQNLWILNGSRKALPSMDYNDCGYIGDILSNTNCEFSDKIPTITVNFTRVHSNVIPAVTITWGKIYGEFAKDFIVTAYNGNTVVARKEVINNNSAHTVVMMDIKEYDRITISILRWCLPNRRARIEKIYIGMNKIYTKVELMDYSHTQTADPLSTSLPKAEITFSVDNSTDLYNPHNKDGLYKYLIERQEVKTRYGQQIDKHNVEWIKGGTFYLSEWNIPQNDTKATFTARDLLEYMSSTFYEGVYSKEGKSLYNLAVQLFEKANLPSNSNGTLKWNIDESLKNIYTNAPLPIDTIANNLQLVANAGGCVFYQDREGVLNIRPIDTTPSDYEINLKYSYSIPEIEVSKPIKQVNVSAYQYFEETSATELCKADLDIIGTSEVWLTYSSMGTDVSATVENGTLVSAEYYANACKLTITGNGTVNVLISGKTLKEVKTEVTAINNLIGETITLDNPLITSRDRAFIIGEWMRAYLDNRTILKASWRPDTSLDALDVISVDNNYTSDKVVMTEVSYDYDGTFSGSCEGRVI